MTTIAWDGKTLAADRLGNAGSMMYETTKIRKTGYLGDLLFAAGQFSEINMLYKWYEEGADPDKWPKHQDGDKWEALMVIKSNKTIWRYETQPTPWRIEAPFYAIGTGRDYAMAAMHLGKTSKEAVEIAALFDPNTGMGINTLTLD